MPKEITKAEETDIALRIMYLVHHLSNEDRRRILACLPYCDGCGVYLPDGKICHCQNDE